MIDSASPSLIDRKQLKILDLENPDSNVMFVFCSRKQPAMHF